MNQPLHTRLEFPLNVFAHSLYLQEGQVDYLCYGLVEVDETIEKIGVHFAQHRATELFLAHLPPPPCHILQVGVELGTMVATLVQLGYQVTAISLHALQVTLIEQRVQGHISLQCVDFKEFNALAQSYDVILLRGSTRSFSALQLFNKAHYLLKDSGKVLLMDEFSLKRLPTDDIEPLPFLNYRIAQAERCGFKLSEQVDLSSRILPTLVYLSKLIDQQYAQLLADLAISTQQLDELLINLQLHQQKYNDNRYGYLLLAFEKMEIPRWKIAEVMPQDQNAVRELFAQVFEYAMTPERWHWKYGEQRGLGMAAWQDKQMVAHYGGILRRLQYFGVPKMGVQIADVMVSAKERGTMKRQGAFFLVSATFPEYYAGYGAPILLGFGFPTQRAIRIAELLGIYAEVGKMTEIRWSTTTGKSAIWSRVRHLRPHERSADGDIVNQLWTKMSPYLTKEIVGVRDWQYIKHRYFEHPDKQYELLLVSHRFSGQPLGIVALQRQGEICRLLDIIAPLDKQTLTTLIQQTCRIVGNWGVSSLTLWITDKFAPLFLAIGGEQHLLDIRIPHCIWYEGPPVEEVQGHWWLTGGDTDFL